MELFDSSSINFSCCALKNGKFSSAKNYESGSIVLLILLSGAFCFLLHTLSRKCYVVRYFMLSFLFLFFGVCACVFVSDKLFAGDFANVLVTFSFRFFFSLARKKIIVFFRYAFFFFYFVFPRLTFAL